MPGGHLENAVRTLGVGRALKSMSAAQEQSRHHSARHPEKHFAVHNHTILFFVIGASSNSPATDRESARSTRASRAGYRLEFHGRAAIRSRGGVKPLLSVASCQLSV